MKRMISLILTVSLLVLTGCMQEENPTETVPAEGSTEAIVISLADSGITCDSDAVYTANDIIYYESGKDFTYGEGTEADAHTAEEAAEHTVVHITQPGTYILKGKLSKGQVAVDLGKEAKEDPSAVVTLVLNGVDITCEVAPAVIFYNVYECGDDDEETASKDVDTSAAGANVIIADGTSNYVNGSYVARIYEPGTVELSEDGTEVEDADKLHKYDAAFYSRMSMNVDGGEEDTGLLAIKAENEGLDSELHLTVNGGNISIISGNDGINTNEDGVSVTTINGGTLSILVTGETGEGDGIDSNGWLVINGGTVIASACASSADAGIDSDMGIHINGGTVIATGHMLDRIEDGGQTYAVFRFREVQDGGTTVTLENEAGEDLMNHVPQNDYSILIYSSPELAEGTYTLWSEDTQLSVSGGMGGGFGGGMRPGGMMPGGAKLPELEGFDPTELPRIPFEGEGGRPFEDAAPPEGFEFPDGMEPPEGFERPEKPERTEEGQMGQRPGGKGGRDFGGETGEVSETVSIQTGGNMFEVQ